METRFLETFRRTAELGSFTRAARHLGYSQSTVSAQIQALEEETRTPLFDRTGRKLRLTEGGRELLELAEEMLALQRRIPHLADGASQPQGDLTVAAAHLGGFGMWDESERVLIGKDIWLDLSHTFNWMSDEQIVRMARNHGIDRILWGTDAPWQKPSAILKRFLEQPFTDAERRKILWTNAHKLLRIPEDDGSAV